MPWLPAKSLTIDQEWSRKTDQLTQGEPVTRTLTVNAEGVAAEQLPPIGENLSINGLKIYPDKPQLDTQTGPNGLSSSRIDSLSVVPNQSGTLEIPAIDITWWDTQADQLRVASIPAQPLLINAASQPAANVPNLPSQPLPSLDTAQPGPSAAPTWLYALCAGLALSNALFVGLWLSARAQHTGARSRLNAKSPLRSCGRRSTRRCNNRIQRQPEKHSCSGFNGKPPSPLPISLRLPSGPTTRFWQTHLRPWTAPCTAQTPAPGRARLCWMPYCPGGNTQNPSTRPTTTLPPVLNTRASAR